MRFNVTNYALEKIKQNGKQTKMVFDSDQANLKYLFWYFQP